MWAKNIGHVVWLFEISLCEFFFSRRPFWFLFPMASMWICFWNVFCYNPKSDFVIIGRGWRQRMGINYRLINTNMWVKRNTITNFNLCTLLIPFLVTIAYAVYDHCFSVCCTLLSIPDKELYFVFNQ